MTAPNIDLDALEAAALAATPQDFDSAEIVQKNGGDIECPACGVWSKHLARAIERHLKGESE